MRALVFTREDFDQLLGGHRVLRSEIDQLKTEICLLHEKVQYLMKKLFGRSSEKLSPDQMQLAFEELRGVQEALELAEAKAEETQEKKESGRGKRKPLDARHQPGRIPTRTLRSSAPNGTKRDPRPDACAMGSLPQSPSRSRKNVTNRPVQGGGRKDAYGCLTPPPGRTVRM